MRSFIGDAHAPSDETASDAARSARGQERETRVGGTGTGMRDRFRVSALRDGAMSLG